MHTESGTGDESLKNVHAEVSMLGGFEICINGECVTEEVNRAQKMWRLLAYIIVHKDKMMAKDELIDMLWQDEEIENPNSALKNLLYRIRMTLKEHNISQGQDVIIAKGGAYSWNPKIPCQVDFERFEQLYEEAKNDTTHLETKKAKYRQAIALYKGDFLPKAQSYEWVMPIQIYLHNIYLRAVEELMKLLDHKRDAQEILEICKVAISLDGFDEKLHYYFLLALINQGKQKQALLHYEYLTNSFYQQLGVALSDELQDLYQVIMRSEKSMEMDLDVIKQDLREAECIEGAFHCEYGFFKEIYRLQARCVARTGQSVFVALLTINDLTNEVPGIKVLSPAMEQLSKTLHACLRKGDVVARYSVGQYVVMLSSLTIESATKVVERVINKFLQQSKKTPIRVHYKILPIDPI